MLLAPPLGCNPLLGVLRRRQFTWRSLGPPRHLYLGPAHHATLDEWVTAVADGATPMDIFGGDCGTFKALHATVGRSTLELNVHFCFKNDYAGSGPDTLVSCSALFDGVLYGACEPRDETSALSICKSLERVCDEVMRKSSVLAVRDVRQAFRATF